MMGLPTKWWLLGGGLLVTLWLVWQAPPAPDSNTEVVAARAPVNKPTVQADDNQAAVQNDSDIRQSRQPLAMVSDLFRTPPAPVVTAVVRQPQSTLSATEKSLPDLPFRYIGRIEKDASVTVFIMEGDALHLLQAGDSPRTDYQLEAIDLAAGELRWRYLPTQKIRKMSIQP